jgi:hypothetical protein
MTDPTDRPDLTIVAEASAMYGRKLIFNCGNGQPVGVVELQFNDWGDPGPLYCKCYRIILQEITPEACQMEYMRALANAPSPHEVASPAPSGGQADQPAEPSDLTKGGYVGWKIVAEGSDGHTLLLEDAIGTRRRVTFMGRKKPPPAEPSERELPTHWGHWVRNGEHYWVYGHGPMFHIQRLNTETGLPHEDTADFAITLNSAEMRGHWRPAVPDRPGGRAGEG